MVGGADSITEIVAKWAKSNADRITSAYALKGGWEVWAQVALSLYGQSRFPQSQVRREQSTYNASKERCDIVVVSSQSPRVQVLELKVELNNKTNDDLAKRMWLDITKLEGMQPADGYINGEFCAIAVSQTMPCYTAMQNFVKSKATEKWFLIKLDTRGGHCGSGTDHKYEKMGLDRTRAATRRDGP